MNNEVPCPTPRGQLTERAEDAHRTHTRCPHAATCRGNQARGEVTLVGGDYDGTRRAAQLVGRGGGRPGVLTGGQGGSPPPRVRAVGGSHPNRTRRESGTPSSPNDGRRCRPSHGWRSSGSTCREPVSRGPQLSGSESELEAAPSLSGPRSPKLSSLWITARGRGSPRGAGVKLEGRMQRRANRSPTSIMRQSPFFKKCQGGWTPQSQTTSPSSGKGPKSDNDLRSTAPSRAP